MERTKYDTRTKSPSTTYSVEQEPIVISKHTLDILLSTECPGDTIALYSFYYYTAKWQGTNTVKATTGYTARGLKWSEDRVRRVKKYLLDFGLVEDKATKDPNGKITGHFIHVHLLWQSSKTTLMDSLTVVTPQTNALRTNNKYIREEDDKKSVKSSKHISRSMFEDFWKLYPRKIDKGKALTKWVQICSREESPPTWGEIKLALLRQSRTERWQDAQYIPHPTTWLNQRRWLDDPEKMNGIARKGDKPDKILEFGDWWYLHKNGYYYNEDGKVLRQ